MTLIDYKNCSKVMYKGKNYAVISLKYKKIVVPVVLDWADYSIIHKLNKYWKCHRDGLISCYHSHKDKSKEIYMHHLIMAFIRKEKDDKLKKCAIHHINRIGLDNRRANIMYNDTDKPVNRNGRKKKRTIDLPENCGITVQEMPTYVWYMKPDGTHGDRFMVDVGSVKWKTTSSKKVSLRYKLEEAKKFLRELKENQPEIFEKNCMNGEFNKEGKEQLEAFYKIVHRAGFTNIKKITTDNRTDRILQENGEVLNEREQNLLDSHFDLIIKQSQKRRLFNNIVGELTVNKLPEHVYYQKPRGSHNGYFVYEEKGKDIKIHGPSRGKLSAQAKYDELMKKINRNGLTKIK